MIVGVTPDGLTAEISLPASEPSLTSTERKAQDDVEGPMPMFLLFTFCSFLRWAHPVFFVSCNDRYKWFATLFVGNKHFNGDTVYRNASVHPATFNQDLLSRTSLCHNLHKTQTYTTSIHHVLWYTRSTNKLYTRIPPPAKALLPLFPSESTDWQLGTVLKNIQGSGHTSRNITIMRLLHLDFLIQSIRILTCVPHDQENVIMAHVQYECDNFISGLFYSTPLALLPLSSVLKKMTGSILKKSNEYFQT